MDRARFEHLLEAYGADFRRWPADERAAAAAFKLRHGLDVADDLAAARALDATLDSMRIEEISVDALAGRILAARPPMRETGFDRRALFALAACAVFGVLVGYGGGRLAPTSDAADAYFAMAFETPFEALGEEG